MARSTAPAASTEDPQVTADLFVCPNCDTTTPGPFCFHCGQKRPVDADLSLRHAGRYVVEELLNLDGRLLTTVKLLFTRPWRLTLDFFEGRRARHVHPLRLFLAFSADSSPRVRLNDQTAFRRSSESASRRARARSRRERSARPPSRTARSFGSCASRTRAPLSRTPDRPANGRGCSSVEDYPHPRSRWSSRFISHASPWPRWSPQTSFS